MDAKAGIRGEQEVRSGRTEEGERRPQNDGRMSFNWRKDTKKNVQSIS